MKHTAIIASTYIWKLLLKYPALSLALMNAVDKHMSPNSASLKQEPKIPHSGRAQKAKSHHLHKRYRHAPKSIGGYYFEMKHLHCTDLKVVLLICMSWITVESIMAKSIVAQHPITNLLNSK